MYFLSLGLTHCIELSCLLLFHNLAFLLHYPKKQLKCGPRIQKERENTIILSKQCEGPNVLNKYKSYHRGAEYLHEKTLCTQKISWYIYYWVLYNIWCFTRYDVLLVPFTKFQQTCSCPPEFWYNNCIIFLSTKVQLWNKISSCVCFSSTKSRAVLLHFVGYSFIWELGEDTEFIFKILKLNI